MGIQKNMYFKGRQGNWVYYKRLNTACVRIQAENVNQTEATKISSKRFGLAAKTAKSIRLSAAPILTVKPDRDLINRLTKTVNTCFCNDSLLQEKPLSYITGFSFFEKAAFASRIKFKIPDPVINEKGMSIEMPAFIPIEKITAPAHTIELKLKFAATAIDRQKPDNYECSHVILNVDYTDVLILPQEILLPLTVSENNIALLMIAIEYTVTKNGCREIVNEDRWMPAGIMYAAMY